MDVIALSRIQFALTTMFHILFPTLTIGLALYLVVVEFLWLKMQQELYYRIYRYWAKIFAINFGVGVVTGVVLEFEFGTNFSRFSLAVSNVFSPLLAFEVLTAFFLEAGFLGIMIFGWDKVPRGVHFLATCLVSLGSVVSAFWILAANSWMQTPAGYELVNGRFMLVDFWAVTLNPSTLIRVGHMVMASLETSAFVVAGISAYYLLKGKHVDFSQRSLSIALIMAALFAPLQVYLGDRSGVAVFHHQPAKLAAMEAHWETNTTGGASYVVMAIPDPTHERNLFEITIPNGLSLLVTRSPNGRVQGLREFSREYRPNVSILFWSFRFMVAAGFLFLLIMLWAAVLRYRERLYLCRPFLWTLVIAHPLGFLATELGWITAEVGRQPWVVYNLMKTAEGVSPIPAGNVVWSLILFLAVFPVIGAIYFFYVLKTLHRGPDLSSPIPPVQRPIGMEVLSQVKRNKETE
jgi:cytochrome bd ubiquinol oxidase subunit I